MFLLVGTAVDPCLGEVEAELRARGHETMVLGPEQLPAKRILWELGGSAPATDYYSFAGQQLQGVLLRETWLGTYPAWLEAEDAGYVGMESHAAFGSFLSSLGVPVINRPQFRFLLAPLHTALDLGPVLAGCGFRSQRTLVTSDLGAARQFLLDGGGYALLGSLLDTAALLALTSNRRPVPALSTWQG
jgi:hypothetical protein